MVWFSFHAGNSLVGARRQVLLRNYWVRLVGVRLPGTTRCPRMFPGDCSFILPVYHFLAPDKGMADYKDKVVKELVPEEIEKIKEWRNDFNKPFDDRDVRLLERLSRSVDKLWDTHVDELRKLRHDTTDPLPLWGQPGHGEKVAQQSDLAWKDAKFEKEFLSKEVRFSSPTGLELVMNCWCSLWFWPIDRRIIYRVGMSLDELQYILEGKPMDDKGVEEDAGQMTLFPDTRRGRSNWNWRKNWLWMWIGYARNFLVTISFEINKRYRFHH